jgi:asparaginyl-tRNA synthetase
VGERIEVRGWISHRRSSGKIQFLVIRDGSGVMQCVAGVQDLTPEEWSACQTLTQESAVIVRAGADPRHR